MLAHSVALGVSARVSFRCDNLPSVCCRAPRVTQLTRQLSYLGETKLLKLCSKERTVQVIGSWGTYSKGHNNNNLVIL